MSNLDHKATGSGMRVSERNGPPLRPFSVLISGQWAITEERLAEIIDGALHDVHLCACADPRQFYALTVREIPEARTSAGQPDNT